MDDVSPQQAVHKRWKWKEDGGSVKEIESNLYYYNRKVKVNAFVDEDEKPCFYG